MEDMHSSIVQVIDRNSTFDLPKLHCQRCQHEWWPRALRAPRVCPRCKDRKWDQARPLRVTGRVDKLVAR